MVLPLYVNTFFPWHWHMLSITWKSFSTSEKAVKNSWRELVREYSPQTQQCRKDQLSPKHIEENPDLHLKHQSLADVKRASAKLGNSSWILGSRAYFTSTPLDEILCYAGCLYFLAGHLMPGRKGTRLLSGVPELMIPQVNVFGENSKTSS